MQQQETPASDTRPGLNWLKKDAAGLVTVVVQDRESGMVRMVAHADEAAVGATLRTGQGHFFSRSRQRLWRKGETSGNTPDVVEVRVDCDADCLIYVVDAVGPSCHTGGQTCFFRRLDRRGAVTETSTKLAWDQSVGPAGEPAR